MWKHSIAFFSAFFLAQSALAVYPVAVDLKLAPPPRPGSDIDRKDYAILHQVQKSRTSAECKAASAQTMLMARNLYGPALGILSEGEFRALEPLLTETVETVSKASKPFKDKYARIRPYENDSTLRPCIRIPGGKTSYPSSHAAVGVVLGHVLETAFPKRSAAIRAEAIQIGDNRVIGGVHHPSDIVAGRKLGEQIWDALKMSPEFTRDLAEAKRALR